MGPEKQEVGDARGRCRIFGREYQKFSFIFVKFEVSVRYPSEDIKKTIRCAHLEFRREIQMDRREPQESEHG